MRAEGAGGRRGRSGRRASPAFSFSQAPWGQQQNPHPPMALISEDALEAIHEASLTVLEEIGLDFMHDEARAILKAAGAQVANGSQRVRMDRAIVMDAIASCPSEFTIHARNPERNLRLGGTWIANCAVASAPNVSDLDRGRRTGNRADFQNLLKLIQHFNIIQVTGGYPVEPIDLHPSIRHLEGLRDIATLTDKAFHAYSLGQERITDGIE